MAEAVYKLYRACPLDINKRFKIDNIELYLDNKYFIAELKGQYFHHKLDTEVVINLAQTNKWSIPYISIKNADDERTYYYYVTGNETISNNSRKLYLRLDTLNTFYSDKLFTRRTSIIREHRDRFYRQLPNPAYPHIYRRAISRVSEGINPPLYKDYKGIISEASPFNLDWYLIYQTRKDLSEGDTDNPVECLCVASDKVLVSKGTTGDLVTLYPLDLDNLYYYIVYDDSPTGFIEGETSQELLPYRVEFTTSLRVIEFHKSSTTELNINKYYYRNFGGQWGFNAVETLPNNPKNITLHNIKNIFTSPYIIRDLSTILNANKNEVSSGVIGNRTIKSINEIDRTDPRLIKILKLPYAPFKINRDGDTLLYDKNKWNYDNGVLKLKDLSIEFVNELNDPYKIGDLTSYFKADLGTPTLNDERRLEYESKMYHSDFFTLKFSYDNLNYVFKLEDMRFNDSFTYFPNIKITYKPTNTINSKSLFKFEVEFYDYQSEEDYEGVMIVDKNNEAVIYNNGYINYIKNGYNYDKQSKSFNEINNWLGTGLQVGGSVVSAIAGVAGGNVISSASAISLGISAIQSIANNINYSITADRSIQRKLVELKNQATNVSGANDIDLLQYYNDNRLWLITYKPAPIVSKNINDLFYYTGYAYPVKTIPNTTSRTWFNYLQCEADFTSEAYDEIAPQFLDDLKEQLSLGVTIFHEVNGERDENQTKENYETFILGR